MNQKIKDMWVKALKSGDFKQGIGYLEKDGAYCALGVLSLLSMLDGQCTYDLEDGAGKYDNKKYSLSFNTMKWAGISQENEGFLAPEASKVEIHYKGKMTTISYLNDEGKSFKEIARIIELHL